jgi:hypothetical protein
MTNFDDAPLRKVLDYEDYEEDYDFSDYDDEAPPGPLPLEPAQRGALQRAIDAGLSGRGWDNTLCAAKAWARREKVPWAWLRDELEDRGGFCDCEVLLNVFRPPES